MFLTNHPELDIKIKHLFHCFIAQECGTSDGVVWLRLVHEVLSQAVDQSSNHVKTQMKLKDQLPKTHMAVGRPQLSLALAI